MRSIWRGAISFGMVSIPVKLYSGGEAKVRSKELEMARSLVENLSDRFKPEEYRDEYRVALEELIARKLKGEQRSAKRRKPEPKLTDLMEALKQSVEASRTSRRAAAKPQRKARARKTRAA
jgi:DNA end-binding protein Ku